MAAKVKGRATQFRDPDEAITKGNSDILALGT